MWKREQLFLWFIGFVVLWSATAGAFYFWVVKGSVHRDFYPRWAGARMVLLQHRDPYSEETTHAMQVELYGKVFPPNVDQQGFAYPAILIVVLLPFWFISNVEVSTAVWIGLAVALYTLTLLLLRDIHGPPIFFVLIFLLWYFPLLSLFQGQVTALIMASLGIGYWAYRKHHDVWAGAVLAVGLVKPQLMLFPLAAVLLLAGCQRRYKVWYAFLVTSVLLFLSSFVIAGFWIPGWLGALARYQKYAKVSWALGMLWQYSPLLGSVFGVVIIALLWFFMKQPDFFFAASVPAGMLLLPQTLIWGLTMLLIPLTLMWYQRSRYMILGIWVLGWVSIIGNLVYVPHWWVGQNVLFPLLALGIVGYAYYEKGRDLDREAVCQKNMVRNV